MKRTLLLLALAAWSIYNPPCARGETQIIVISDIHSFTRNMEGFMLWAAHEGQKFLDKHPKGTLILAAAGDIGGISPWTEQYGNEVWEMLAVMSSQRQIVAQFGNHETWDVNAGGILPGQKDGNELFVEQIQTYQAQHQKVSGRKPFLLNSSIEPTTLGQGIFRPYQDVPLKNGKTIRFLGLVLDEFFKKCMYRPTGRGVVFKLKDGEKKPEVKPAQVVLRNALLTARLNHHKPGGVRIDALIPMAHDYYEKVQTLKEGLDRTLAEANPGDEYPAIPLAIGAHDHVQQDNQNLGVVDAGSDFRAVVVELNEDFERTRIESLTRQGLDDAKKLSWDALTPPEHDFLTYWKEIIDQRAVVLKTPATHAPLAHTYDNKENTKKRKTRSGEFSANSMAIAGHEQVLRLYSNLLTRQLVVDRTQSQGPIPVIAFYNSSSYRHEITLKKGTIPTYEDSLLAYSFRGHPQVGIFTAHEVFLLHQSLSRERLRIDRTHTPQLSTNLQIVPANGSRKGTIRVAILPDQWVELKPGQRVALVLDSFLASNGYDVETWRQIVTENRWLPPLPAQTHLMQEHLFELGTKKDCMVSLMEAFDVVRDRVLSDNI